MSFLLSRAYSAFGGSGGSSNRQQYSSSASAGEAALFDADDEEERDARSLRMYSRNIDEDDDDELEAAFGGGSGSNANNGRHVRSGTGDESNNDNDGDGEGDRLLEEGNSYAAAHQQQQHPVASGSGSSSRSQQHPRYSRTNSSATLGNLSTVSAGGYDFEADPYDRRSAAVASTSDLHHQQPAVGNGRRSRRMNPSTTANGAAGGILAFIRDNVPLPARLRQYGPLSVSGSTTHSSGRRRADGNADADDDDDEDEEEQSSWIMPPQSSMPGLFGGGTKNDGVFSNMTAKPGSRRLGRDGEEIVGGDDEIAEKEIPPAYEMAVLDSAPPYFDTTVHTSGGPGALGGVSSGLEEILIEGLPLGNLFSFFWSLLVSMSFQFVGFLLTTLLSTSHAAKNGSRAGLGVTLIQYGLYLGQELSENAQFAADQSGAGGSTGKDDWTAFWGTPDTASSAGAVVQSATSTAASAIATGASSLSVAVNSTDPWDGPILLDGNSAMSGVANSWISMVLMIAGWCEVSRRVQPTTLADMLITPSPPRLVHCGLPESHAIC